MISKPISILASGSLTIQAGVSVIFTSEDAGLSVFGKSLVILQQTKVSKGAKIRSLCDFHIGRRWSKCVW